MLRGLRGRGGGGEEIALQAEVLSLPSVVYLWISILLDRVE